MRSETALEYPVGAAPPVVSANEAAIVVTEGGVSTCADLPKFERVENSEKAYRRESLLPAER